MCWFQHCHSRRVSQSGSSSVTKGARRNRAAPNKACPLSRRIHAADAFGFTSNNGHVIMVLVCPTLSASFGAALGMRPVWRTQIIEQSSDGTIPQADDDVDLWRRVHAELDIGAAVTGAVICRRPFGVFLDIGYGASAAALLLVPEFADARKRRITFEEYPQVGESLTATVLHISWDQHKIALTQNQSFNPESRTWNRP